MSLLQHISDFLTSCRARRLSPRTVEWYEWILSEYRDFVEEQRLDWERPGTVDAFLARVTASASAHTTHGHYRALRRFFNWLEKRRLISGNPILVVEPPRLPDRQPRHVTTEIVTRLLRAVSGDDWSSLRDRAVILLLWDTGLRATEVCGLRLGDVDREQCLLLCRNGKGG